ncbi:MAG: hypothetical protein HYY24_12050 [Verrucomicrobia bacterium]|nr:hypothetical protein [Verrucomicrobiota bacterium]
MWKHLFELLHSALFLARDVAQLRGEVARLREEMGEVQRALNQLAHGFGACLSC